MKFTPHNPEFILKTYIKRHIKAVPPKYTYPEETGVNPAFQRIEEIKQPLHLNQKKIFALRSDFILATGVKNSEQEHGYQGLNETFLPSQYPFLNWQDRYGHPSIAIKDGHYDGTVLYAGFICQRQEHLQVFLSSGRYNRHERLDEGIGLLATEQTQIIEAYLALKLQKAFGQQDVIFYDTTLTQDAEDTALFFRNKEFPATRSFRRYNTEQIMQAVAYAEKDSCYPDARTYIQKNISAIKPKYNYANEEGYNPAYQEINQIEYPLNYLEKRIWVLRSDFILATGIKNAYEQEYAYHGFKESFSTSVTQFINWQNRYGHPSLTQAEADYDGSAFYAGYLCQRQGYLQVYLVSGRFERSDLNPQQITILEAYIAAQLQTAYGEQEIVFDYGNSEVASYHATFFANGQFAKDNPQRRYTSESIRELLGTVSSLLSNQEEPAKEEVSSQDWRYQ